MRQCLLARFALIYGVRGEVVSSPPTLIVGEDHWCCINIVNTGTHCFLLSLNHSCFLLCFELKLSVFLRLSSYLGRERITLLRTVAQYKVWRCVYGKCPVIGIETKILLLSSVIRKRQYCGSQLHLDGARVLRAYVMVRDVRAHYDAAKSAGTDVAPAREL